MSRSSYFKMLGVLFTLVLGAVLVAALGSEEAGAALFWGVAGAALLACLAPIAYAVWHFCAAFFGGHHPESSERT